MASVPTLRDTWLALGVSTLPSDRPTAEAAVADLYRHAGFRCPEFLWVPSPPAGAELVVSEQLSGTNSLTSGAAARIASTVSRSRERMDNRTGGVSRRWPSDSRSLWAARTQPLAESARQGIAPDELLRIAVWDSLRTSLFDGVAAAVRSLVQRPTGSVAWYGQQEAHRLAYYDIHRTLGISAFRGTDHAILDTQTALAGATGWWWAFDNVCVMSERPGFLQTEPLPGAVHNERRLHGQNEPAVQFADGRSVHVDHGTIVPEWVIAEPTVERIARERNIEVRRCAIERIGWDVYIDEAGLELVDRTGDPGNAGAPLSLYATPTSWVDDGRILLVVNGSVERDGRRRRYGLPVPNGMTSALDAAGWTYGITGDDYSCLVRRT
ncbi:DUF6745 domain-containing protein [Rhodococcus sp. MEB041]|uniref:DUF6745 domain-containing protein n=2 Tax=Rhodococcus TaxID=1827 RepID=UPI002549C3AE|nr:hypothetical protein [Rhodococcus sp. MEB041]